MIKDADWKKLRQQIERERKRFAPIQDSGSNKEKRLLAVTLTSAYAGVLRMMDRIEAAAQERDES